MRCNVDKCENEMDEEGMYIKHMIEQIKYEKDQALQDERRKIKREMGNITLKVATMPGKKLKLRYAPWFEEFWEKQFMRNK
ncbi:MAG: hypothetical protein IIA83_12130 [Thaumarchaeota archaeon]|nr:hypothetical protein [Nitrososphaerota archaeon]